MFELPIWFSSVSSLLAVPLAMESAELPSELASPRPIALSAVVATLLILGAWNRLRRNRDGLPREA